jgi:hypothetical protein
MPGHLERLSRSTVDRLLVLEPVLGGRADAYRADARTVPQPRTR